MSVLLYVDLHNFNGSSLTSFAYILYYCTSLMYVNLRNFKIPNTDNVSEKNLNFDGVSTNEKFCIEDLATKNWLFEEYGEITFNCSDFCLQDNVYFDS